jgi:predicted nucleic acid-binding protein
MSSTSGSAFLDTNVLVYFFDESTPEKAEIAREILRTVRPLVLSTQVLQEFYVVATRKLEPPFTGDEAVSVIEGLAELEIVRPDVRTIIAAARLATEATISFWDALILRAASDAGCERLLSEDLAEGAIHAGVRVENPFAVAA